MNRTYISAHSLELAKALSDKLKAAAIPVLSTWHNEAPVEGGRGKPPTDREYWLPKANANFNNILACDFLVLIAGPDKYTGGKFVEAGYALGVNMRVLVLGRPENGMIGGAAWKFFSTEEELITFLQRF